MKRDSNSYIFLYSTLLIVVVAVLLAVAATALRPAQLENEKTEKRVQILSAIGVTGEVENQKDKKAYVRDLYAKYIKEELVVTYAGAAQASGEAFELSMDEQLKQQAKSKDGKFPVFVAQLDDGSRKYIFPMAGSGLWGPIWGYMALNDDLNTVFGAAFSHKGETPGLGAEIETEHFSNEFKGKQLYDGEAFKSIAVVKRGAQGPYQVDGITGGTMTSQGVQRMIEGSLSVYGQYIAQQRKGVINE